jgi:hypothetical protein
MKRQATTATHRSAAAAVAKQHGLLDHQHSFGPSACVQRERDASHTHAPVSQLNDVLNAPGRPLDADTRASMEPRFGQDFSNVRVHTDDAAAESANALGANAFAAGNHIAFAHGQYAPQTETGSRLIAHELTHVVQQGPAAGAMRRTDRFEIAGSTDDNEHAAEQIGAGLLDARHARALDRAKAGGQVVQMQKAPQQKPKAPATPVTTAGKSANEGTPQAREIPADEAWLFAENRIVTEIETRYEELVRLAAFKTRQPIETFFDDYDDELKADAPFSTFLGIAGSSAGNVPNDPASIQPAPAGSPKGTPGGPIPQTFSASGAIAGALSGSISPLVSLILDYSEVGEVKKHTTQNIEQFLAEGLMTSSPTFSAFEAQARSELRGFFLSSWANRGRHDATELSDVINETALEARTRYGATSALGLQVVAAVQSYVDSQLISIRPVLDQLEHSHRKRRYGAFALGGGIVGGLLGGALGFGLGGGSGLAIGAGIGLLGGGLVGLGAAGLTNLFSSTAEEKRKERALGKPFEHRAPDILEPKYRAPKTPGSPEYA